MSEIFKVETLDEITSEHFKAACVAAMAEEAEMKGLLGVPVSGEYVIWKGKEKGKVKVRNYCHMLELIVAAENGFWLTEGCIDGMGAEAVLDEAYRRFLIAKPYIEQKPEHSFEPTKMKEGTEKEWLETAKKYIDEMAKLAKEAD